MPKISIVVPVYNVEQYLAKCIDSVIGQSLKDIEIILVDDGATDKSPEICNEYALKDNRVRVIHKQNGGLSDARNAGIEVAQGEYIAFLDSDDWVEYNFYEFLYNIAIKEEADIVQCDYVEAYTEDIKIQLPKTVKECTYTSVEALKLFYGEEYVKTVVVWNKIYCKKLFEHIRFPKGKIHEDEFTTYKVIHAANKLVSSNVKMVYYRQREGSIMAQGFNENRLYVLEAWKEKREYFKQQGLDDLAQKVDMNLCWTLKDFYVQAKNSNLVNKKEILKVLKRDMRKEYIGFLKNPYITNRGKITITLCIINGQAFCKMYDTYVESRRF